MDTKRDIETRNDIYQFLKSFYDSVKANDTIGFIFTDIAHIDWEKHIPVITDFWESILLDNPVYHNNAMSVHYDLNKIFPLEKKHFDAWLSIFEQTINKMHAGKITELAKKRAIGIAALMQFKMAGDKVNGLNL